MTTPNSFSGSAQATTLGTAITTTSQLTFTIASTTGWVETIGSHIGSPLGTSGNFVITLDYGTASEEKVLCASLSGTTVTVATGGRGYDGTTATTHAATTGTVVHTISTDVPYQANLGVTNAATASTAAAAAQTTANSALTAANTIKSNVWSTGSYTTGNPFTNLTGITGYTNYLITATASYLNTGGAANNIAQAIQINGSGSYAAQNFILAASGATRGAATSTYALASSPSSTISVSLSVSATQAYTPSNFQIQVIGYN